MSTGLREALAYDPLTGVITWKVHTNKIRPGDVAGHKNSRGYREIKYKGKTYKEHRVAFLLYYGVWPSKCIDHINRIKDDNRLCNIRDCTLSDNQLNRGVASNNKSGVTGVSYCKNSKRWVAKAKLHSTIFASKRFKTYRDAVEHMARIEKERHLASLSWSGS